MPMPLPLTVVIRTLAKDWRELDVPPKLARLQIFNFVYFTISSFAVTEFMTTTMSPFFDVRMLAAFSLLCATLMVLPILDLFKSTRAIMANTNPDCLPRWLKKSLRGTALGLPIVFIVLLGLNAYALESTKLPSPIFSANLNELPRQDIPTDYASRLDTAANLSFYNVLILDVLSERARIAGFAYQAQRIAEQELRLFPDDRYALFLKYSARALMPQHRVEARNWVLNELKIYPKIGLLWSLKARIDNLSGNYADALEAAQHHLQFHGGTAEAYKQLAEVYANLGDSKNASVNLTQLRKLESSPVHH